MDRSFRGAGNSFPLEVRKQVVELCKQGCTRNEISRRTGIGNTTVTKIAARAGLTFDRTKTARGVEAHSIDMAARRAKIIERQYGRIEKILDRLEEADTEGFRTILKGIGGAEEVRTLTFVPTVDERNMADATYRGVTAVAALEKVGHDAGTDVAKSFLAGLGQALGIVDGP